MAAKSKLLRRVWRLVARAVEQPFALDHVEETTALRRMVKRNTRHLILPRCTYIYAVIVITFDSFFGKRIVRFMCSRSVRPHMKFGDFRNGRRTGLGQKRTLVSDRCQVTNFLVSRC